MLWLGYENIGVALRAGAGVILRGSTKVGGSASISAGLANKTQMLMAKMKRPMKGRVRLKKYGLGASAGIKAAIAPTASVASLSVPSGGIATFKPFVFQTPSHAASDVGTGASAVPKWTYSDWLDFETIPRSDGGSGYLYIIRIYEDATSAGNRVSMATTAPANSSDFETYGWYAAYCLTNGDFTTTTATFTTNTAGPPIMLEFETYVPGKTIAWGGDSTAEGRDAFSLRTHNGMRLAIDALNAEGFNLDYFNQGWSSATTAGGTGSPPAVVSGYWAQMMAMFSGMAKLPDIVCFQPASVNNGGWLVPECNYWCDQFIAWAVSNGVTPVLMLPLPVDGYSSAQEATRVACINAIIAKADAAGILYVDRNSPLVGGTNTGGFAVPADTSDGTHLTATGAVKERDHPVRGWKAVFQSLAA